jgi:hypothetical protein
MKTCTTCGETKPHSEYHSQKKSKDGLRSSCKQCRNLKNSEYRKNNPEKVRDSWVSYKEKNTELVKQRLKDWMVANKEKARARSSEWYAANKEKVKAKASLWQKQNKEKVKAMSAAYYAKNPEKFKSASHTRRARKIKAGGKLSKDLPVKLFKLQRGKCACCKKPLGKNYHMDHIIPLALGGANTDDNIQLLRATCNLQKHTKHPIDFMQQRGFLL